MAKWDNPDVSWLNAQNNAFWAKNQNLVKAVKSPDPDIEDMWRDLGQLTKNLINRLINASYVKPEVRAEYRRYLILVHSGEMH